MVKNVLLAVVCFVMLPTLAHADELLWKLSERHDVAHYRMEQPWSGSIQYVACTDTRSVMVLMYSNFAQSAYGLSIKVGDSLAINDKVYTLKSLDGCVAHFE